MKYFEVESSNKGKRTKVVLQANSRTDVVRIFKNRNPDSSIVKIVETSEPIGDQLSKVKDSLFGILFKKSIRTDYLVSSFRQLAVMVNAGIPIHDSIKEVGSCAPDDTLRNIFTKVDEDLNAGMSLTSSVSAFKNQLGDTSIAMIKLGENTGNMADSLKKLSDILEGVNENKKRFKKALRYPIIVILGIIIAFVIVMVLVVPAFKDVFAQFDAALPLPTRMLMGMEEATSNYGQYLLIALIALYAFVRHSYRTNDSFHASVDKYLLKTYLIGKIVFYSNMHRFTLILSELIKSGIPVVEALDTATLTVTNVNMQERVSLVKVSVQRGISLTDSFRETDLFENMLIQMIRAGEQSGTLDTMTSKVADYFNSRFNEIIDNISSYMEPIILIIMAAMVLLLALGIFLPMWELSAAVQV